mmetsp:Transcript_19482/g.21127  ORF Transcript_19482/g.21127 Transcript_19482/m.21127 type:complete len:169 (+) Transcript_19482:79-585(+)|eukprot:CAMPEP_0173157726 /NCGR_PEP_ID=MMETSP1105-20130129/15821_1 /TAXON_ID=2985 /ORGANISM="Ochromonas sp., Strain BG-1" /LENGTH=168 /DNA_ID=CAMNT_0014075295 /DNA_START=51 /DNA_END=557 /DNA_ORIENTATION=-
MWASRRLTFLSKSISQQTATRVQSRAYQQSSKRLGGGSHHNHNHHHSNEPYAPKHHQTYPNEAYPLGLGPDYKSEGWEVISIGGFIVCFVLLAFDLSDTFTFLPKRPEETFNDWATAEALARRKVRAEGGEIEFGKFYSKPKDLRTYKYTANDEDEDGVPKLVEEDEE